jgi:hypothetical protein
MSVKMEHKYKQMKKSKKPEPLRMSYETYAYLKSLLEREMKLLDHDLKIAYNFIPKEPYERGKLSGVDKANNIFITEYSRLNAMLTELWKVAQATYKDHPNLEMRRFWGLKE